MKRGIFLLIVLSSLCLFSYSQTEKDAKLWSKALKVHENATTVDTHCDTPWALLKTDFNIGERHEAPKSRVDFPRMKEGGLDAMFFAVFTGQKPRTEGNYKDAYLKANEMLDSIHAMVKTHADVSTLALTSDDIKSIEKSGKRAVYIGMENGFPIAKDLSRVKEFYNEGVRYITLCHSFHNDICDSSSDSAEPEHNGLSKFGEEVVAEMNKLGMLVDVSHASDESFYDVIKASKAPIIASHSSVRSVCKHDRNMDDKMIKTLAKHGGVLQLCMLDVYIQEPDTTKERYQLQQKLHKIYRSSYKTMNDDEKKKLDEQWEYLQNNFQEQMPGVKELVDHIDYVKNLVGVDYVGIGSDFDGGGGLADCADVSQFPNITYELLKRGYTSKEIDKIWGGNFLRVFKEVERIAQTLN